MSSLTGAEAEAARQLLLGLRDDRPVHRRRDLLALGISDATQSAMLRRSLLTRLRHGVYAVTDVVLEAGTAQRHRLDTAAAIAAAEEPVWAFGSTSSLLHSLPLPFTAPAAVHLLRCERQDLRSLTRPSRHRLPIPELSITSTASISDDDVCVVAGVPAVRREIAAVTTAMQLRGRWRVALVDAALWQGATTPDDLLAIAGRWRHLGGFDAFRSALDEGRSGAQTPLETFSRLALLAGGLPEPQLQVPFHDGQGLIGIVDMWWPSLGVVGEADGAIKYESKADLLREKAREDRLRALGAMVVRWTWDEIMATPEVVVARIRAAARRAA